ncbi:MULTISPECIES: hypothetical protein [Stenotrophomonas]|jgi:hypothetical protein|uniref:hypothetical protein n=1 Tax=Stenotrophomonas TaxID=40323 RepID=UPI00128F58D1|nr:MULTISPECIES: hypothetical protein [Stenotrophomonas]QOF98327.1 hypothetical protein H7691_17250 [Stenotrophomonas sp. CW117]
MGSITARRQARARHLTRRPFGARPTGRREPGTFLSRAPAKDWTTHREAELAGQRARGEPIGKATTLTELLEWHGKDIKELTRWGRTKEADLKRLASAKKNILRLTTADRITHVEARRRHGAGPGLAIFILAPASDLLVTLMSHQWTRPDNLAPAWSSAMRRRRDWKWPERNTIRPTPSRLAKSPADDRTGAALQRRRAVGHSE